MKKIFAFIGSRRREGNTSNFVKQIVNKLDPNEFEIEFGFPQDYIIEPCIGCATCFFTCKCVNDDDLEILQQKMLEADLLILASPVYLHYFSGEMKMIFDKLSWWAHTLRLQGKPVIILSTCNSNGHMTVIKPLGEFMGLMGGNIIATCNAAELPNQMHNEKWIDEVSKQICERIVKYVNLPPQSNKEIEKTFKAQKELMLLQPEVERRFGTKSNEYAFWVDTGMINYDSFEEYLLENGGK